MNAQTSRNGTLANNSPHIPLVRQKYNNKPNYNANGTYARLRRVQAENKTRIAPVSYKKELGYFEHQSELYGVVTDQE